MDTQENFRCKDTRKVLTNFLPMCQKTAQLCSILDSSVVQIAGIDAGGHRHRFETGFCDFEGV